ncbi:PAS domain-containing protein [Haloarchaeobius sp. DT45]|uniref:PAS domain-containing protein n=1 Tax=Haloarchaeobius sp. DT45 TaxID=3446116 RepID=UPI003F6C2C41
MSGLLVLYVDGDPDTRRTTGQSLAADDAVECLTTSSADDALAELGGTHVDCIVSDYELASQTGIDLLHAVRDRRPDLPFVLYTDAGSETIASEAIQAGVTEYVPRRDTTDVDDLLSRIHEAVQRHRDETAADWSRRQLARLHRSALDIAGATDPDVVVERALVAAERILEFDVCGVYRVDDDGRFEPVTDRSYDPDHTPTVHQGIIGKTYRDDRTFYVPDVGSAPEAAPDKARFRSALSVPISDYGVFQAIAEHPDAFSTVERELAELLVTHVTHALDRIDAERDLRRTNEQLHAILDNTTANIYTKDLEGRYQLVNEQFAERLGLPAEDIVGKTDFDIQSADHAESIRENDRAVIEHGEPVEVEEQAAFAEDESVYYSVKVPLSRDDGEPTGVCGISTDITELKEREAELERQKERLDEFAKLVTHDLKSPLSVAQGYLEVVREDVDHENLGDVAVAHDRMQAIIEDVLTLAREGRQIGTRRQVRLDHVATQAWATVETGEATLDVVTDATVEADPDRLQQVFENLFRNAVEHGGPCAELTVRVGPLTAETGKEEEARTPVGDGSARTGTGPTGFYVEDTGDGFDEETEPAVFEPGFTTSATGTGFGLAIVQSIVDAHGWTVAVTDSDDGGARFEVVF